MGDFQEELGELINHHSCENKSNTPDFILAQFLKSCFDAFNAAVKRREQWYSLEHCPGENESESTKEVT